MICYYKILGVSVRASQEDIKRSFRTLALRWHPDRNPQDARAAERFREALEAYETLVDPKRRARYDRKRGYPKAGAKTHRHEHEEPRNGKHQSYRDVMEEAFGIHFTDARTGNGGIYDLRFDLQVTRSAVAQGAYEEIDYRRSVYCRHCVGNGHRAASNSCKNCNGNGEVEEARTIRIWIPPGSEQGTRLRIAGAGDRLHPGAPPGDLVVLLYIV